MSSCRESVCFHHRTYSLCVAVAFAFLMSMNNVCAQVTIKERVELDRGSSHRVSDNPLTTTLTVPAAGHLKLTYNKGWRRGSAIPSTSHFYASLSGSGNVVDAGVTTHLQQMIQRESTWCPCAQNPQDCDPNTAYFYYPDSSHPFSEFDFSLGDVLPGDVVNIFYQTYGPQGENLLSQVGELFEADTVNGNHVWVAFAGPGDLYWCSWKYEETIQLTVILSPADTAKSFRVVADEDTIGHGDATAIRAIAIDSNGYEAQLDSTTLLRYGATPDTLGSFIAANGDTVPSPLVNVRYIDARLGRIRFAANGSPPDSTLPVAINVVQESDTTKNGTDTVFVKPSIIKILLGETKYVQVKEDPANSARLMVETYSRPEPQGALSGVQFDIVPLVGSRTGVYYESRDSASNTIPTDQKRLIGRFWTPDTAYRVRLTALHGGRTTSREVVVLKPDSLGRSHNRSRDVRDSVVNIDSLCIAVGGKNGIPPQIIKGQMQKESKIASFGFAPSYRYEPFSRETGQLFFHKNNTKWKGNQAYVDSVGMGTVAIPQHQNVRDISYPTTPRRVWYFLEQHSDLATLSPQLRMYGIRLPNGRMNFKHPYGYDEVQDKYDMYFNKIRKEKPQMVDTTVAARGRDSLIVDLRDRWEGGLNNMWAQTRLASSYGLLQMMFKVATEKRYPSNDPSYAPERLNENNVFFPFALAHQDSLLRKVLRADYARSGNWNRGFNDRMHELMRKWNSKKVYADSVIEFSRIYFPIRH
jgi:hypothetical protein